MPPEDRCRTQVLEELRRLLPKLEGFAAQACAVPVGLAAIDAHRPRGGLALAALHEVAPVAAADVAAAFGFLVSLVAALLGRMPREGPLVLVLPAAALRGRPHGHGLHRLGLDPGRLILIETADERSALWAFEEALRSGAPAAVVGVVEKLDLQTSQRLQLAAGTGGRPLLLLRPPRALETTAAMTRWRVATATATRDSFGTIARPRWRLRLERCRNGRPGEWLVEYDHVTHRFALAAALADPALPCGTGAARQAS
jgi:protein ImuA